MSSLQLATALTVVATAAAIVVIRRRSSPFTLPDVPAAHPASSLAPLSLLVAVAAVGALVAVLAAHDPRALPGRDRRGATVIALDVSGSVSAGGPARQLGAALRAVAQRSDGPVGLVVFAERAVEVLPPTTPASTVEAGTHFFVPPSSATKRVSLVTESESATYASATPWSSAFVGDTNISAGLQLARRLLVADRTASGPRRIVLISDLEDGSVQAHLARALAKARRDGVDVSAVPLAATRAAVARWHRLGGAIDHGAGTARGTRVSVGRLPQVPHGQALWLVACALAFAGLIGAGYLWLSPLRPGRSHATRGAAT